MKTIIFAISIIFINTLGQVLLKFSAINNSKLKKMIYLFSGYFLFSIVVIISTLLMKLIELKYFTIVMSLNYVAVFFVSTIIFNEKFNLNKLLGIITLFFGILIFMGDILNDYL